MVKKTTKALTLGIAVLTGCTSYYLNIQAATTPTYLLPLILWACILYCVYGKYIRKRFRPGTATSLLITAMLLPVTIFHITLVVHIWWSSKSEDGITMMKRFLVFVAASITAGLILTCIVYYKDNNSGNSRA